MRGIINLGPVRTAIPVLLAAVVVLCLAGQAGGATPESEQAKIMHKAALAYISIAKELVSRGRYVDAADSLAKASDNSRYLTESELKTLNSLLEEVNGKTAGRDEALNQLESARKLIAEKQYVRAKAILGSVARNPYLTAPEKTQVESLSRQADAGVKLQTAAMKDLYAKSVRQYGAGQLDEARAGFSQVAVSGLSSSPGAKSPEYYIDLIDSDKAAQSAAAQSSAAKAAEEAKAAAAAQAAQAAEAQATEAAKTAAAQAAAAASAEPDPLDLAAPAATVQPAVEVSSPAVTTSNSYMDQVTQQRRRVQSYVETLVESATENARQAVSAGQFDVARSEISLAMQTVEDRRSVLGAEAYGMYMDRLSLLSKQIGQDEVQARKLSDQLAVTEAEEAKRTMRSKQDFEREMKINEYLNTAAALQQETLYEAAIGSLEQVLAIDPMNQTALVQKNLLENLMIYRDYREANAISNREEQKLRVEVARDAIPYVNEITYPRDWKELEKRRQAGKVQGDPVMAAADSEVYKLLDTVVDLSQLTLETPLGEAFEILARSVQPELPLFVNWGDLQSSALNQQSPINMQGLPRVRLVTGLEMLLSAVGGGFVELGYAVDNGLLVVATRTSLPKNLVTHIYQVGDILGAPVNVVVDDIEGSTDGDTTGTDTSTGTTGTTGTSTGTTGTSTGTTGTRTGTTGTDSGTTGTSGESSLGSLNLSIPLDDLIISIIDATEQANWFDYGGDGTIRIIGGNRLIVRQTPKVHSEIDEILTSLRRHLGEQIAIETRFLLVDESYIEDIGLDLDFSINSSSKLGILELQQGSYDFAGQPGISSKALMTSGTYGGIMDDLQVKFLLRATQQNTNSVVFTAPKVTVLSNETAGMTVTRAQTYTSGFTSSGGVATAGVVTNPIIVPNIGTVSGGVSLNVTPTISHDRKYVLLNVRTTLGDFTMSEAFLPYQGATGEVSLFKYEEPLVDNTSIETRVYVPDKGTLLIGGQKIKRHSEVESGVPILSKIPYLGRAFSNRSKSEETKVLLILVRPTIIFTHETEADHISSLDEAMPAFR